MSFPGIQETLLGIGLNDSVCENLARFTSRRFALNLYANYLLQFGVSIKQAPLESYNQKIYDIVKTSRSEGYVVTEEELRTLICEFKAIQKIPDDPWEQLEEAICGMYRTWYADKAVKYRTTVLNVPRHHGVALIVQEMIFGGKICNFSSKSVIY
jgi:phosphoenolpyruvate synthase/pyruvate phosphate dikinase